MNVELIKSYNTKIVNSRVLVIFMLAIFFPSKNSRTLRINPKSEKCVKNLYPVFYDGFYDSLERPNNLKTLFYRCV